ncbi:Efflux pump atB [Metarhizium anisopliae]|nr:Efflux pump atB [Metarhizium anisopliae]
MTTGEKVRGGEDDNGAPAMSESSLSHTLSRTSHTRPLDRIRSQNGYGVDDDSDPAPGDGGEAHKETASPGGSKDPYEVGWDGGDNDPLCPRSFSKGRKWLITSIVSHVSFPLSEFYGRRPIYLVSWTTYVIFLIPQAVAKNIATILVFRFFDGFTGSAFLAVSGGTVGDLFARHELQAPMALFSVSPFVGPSLGPLLGGFINYNADWRWTYYVLLIWSGLVWGAVVFFVPETYHPILLRNKAKKLRQGTGDDRWLAPMEKVHKSVVQAVGRSLRRPFELLIFEPMCLNLCLFSALLLGILYLFFGAFPLVFGTNYGFNLWQVGTSFLGIFVGMILGVLTDPVWHRVRTRLVQKLETETGIPGASEPEFRLPPAIMGAFLVPAGIFMFGWSTYPWVHWIVPIIGSCIFAIGNVLLFTGIFTFLVDAYPLYAASALAANAFVRCIFAAAFPLFGVQMYEKLGFQWASSLLAFLMVAMVPFPYIFFRYGRRIRSNSRYAKS